MLLETWFPQRRRITSRLNKVHANTPTDGPANSSASSSQLFTRASLSLTQKEDPKV